jgi:hypothetical protein
VRRLHGLRGVVNASSLDEALARASRRLAESLGEVQASLLAQRMKEGDVANHVGPLEIRQAGGGRALN